MKRLLVVLLLAASAFVTFVLPATASNYTYGRIPVTFRFGYGTTTGGNVDSTSKYFNKAVGQDTSVIIGVPLDFASSCSAVDSMPIVLVASFDKTTTTGDSLYLHLQGNAGSAVFPAPQYCLANYVGGDAGIGGEIYTFPGLTATNYTGIINTYTYFARGRGARQWRVLARSLMTSGATIPSRFSVTIYYPKFAN